MAYYTREELLQLGFKYVGDNVKISTLASIYDHEKIELGDFSRVDDFSLLSGKLRIGKYCHITPMCLVAGGIPGVVLEDYVTLAYGVKIFAQSDDYSGLTMTNSLVKKEFKNEYLAMVKVGKYSIIGANSTVFPGVNIGEGCAIGAMTLVNQDIDPWGIYFGTPARRMKCRSKELLKLEKEFRERK